MQCPIDQTGLIMADRQGVEIDYCPKCRGIWLDRGELDKIIERSAQYENIQPHQTKQSTNSYKKEYSEDHNYDKKRKREGFLGDLFDF